MTNPPNTEAEARGTLRALRIIDGKSERRLPDWAQRKVSTLLELGYVKSLGRNDDTGLVHLAVTAAGKKHMETPQ